MRRAVIYMLSVAACSRDTPRAIVATGSATGSAIGSAIGSAVAPAPAPPPTPARTRAIPSGPTIDLTHAVPITITLSSTVANPKILPAHLIDGDRSTAWNSRTGDADVWIAITVPPGVVIRQVRMTAGFTAKSPNGEDYFTMNQRIRSVDATTDDGSTAHVNLDIASRELQTIPVVSLDRVRLSLRDIEPGSKPAWREVAISELEVWGSPPPGWIAPATPLVPIVRVVPTGELSTDSMARPITEVDGPCFDAFAGTIAFVKDERAHPRTPTGYGDSDHNYVGECFEVASAVAPATDPAWMTGIAFCAVNDRVYGPTDCHLPLRYAGIDGELVAEYSSARTSVASFDVESVARAGGSWLLVRLALVDDTMGADHLQPAGQQIVVCRASPQAIACTLPIDIAGEHWSTTAAIVGDELVVTAATGSADPGVVGHHALVFR